MDIGSIFFKNTIGIIVASIDVARAMSESIKNSLKSNDIKLIFTIIWFGESCFMESIKMSFAISESE